MQVKSVVNLGAEYEIKSLIQPSILGDCKIHVLIVRSAEPKNTWTRPGVPKYSGASWACASGLERGKGFERGRIEEGAFPGIEAIRILQERINARNKSWQTPLRSVACETRP